MPLVPHAGLPDGLEDAPCPVVGLAIEAQALIDIRRHRLRLIGAGNNTGIIRQSETDYVGEEAVKAELLWARRLCNRHGWPVIDVTRRSIEETSATVLQLMDAWHERRRKRAAATLAEPAPPDVDCRPRLGFRPPPWAFTPRLGLPPPVLGLRLGPPQCPSPPTHRCADVHRHEPLPGRPRIGVRFPDRLDFPGHASPRRARLRRLPTCCAGPSTRTTRCSPPTPSGPTARRSRPGPTRRRSAWPIAARAATSRSISAIPRSRASTWCRKSPPAEQGRLNRGG